MEYTTRDLAEWLGITNRGVHYLEDRGIIHARRDPDNGYRYYDIDEFGVLWYVRNFQDMGFSLEEARRALASPPDELLALLKAHERATEERLQTLRRSIESVELAVSKDFEGRMYSIDARPAFFALPVLEYRVDDPTITAVDRRLQNAVEADWMSHKPPVLFGSQFKKEGDAWSFERCLLVRCDDAERLGLRLDGVVELFEVREYCARICLGPYAHAEDALILEPALRLIERDGLEPEGTVLSFVRHAMKGDGPLMNWSEFWIPLAKERLDLEAAS